MRNFSIPTGILQNRLISPLQSRFYYGWVHVAIAALAMVATLPGRTQGLGLITEPLLNDLKMERIVFAQINFWATLIGAGFCFGIGRLIDRFGSRTLLCGVSFALGTVVLFMSRMTDAALLAILVTLTRGLGQSALSVISITIVGQWFIRRLNLAMAIYTVLLSIGFMVAFPVVGSLVLQIGWRATWNGIGFAILLFLPAVSWLFVRRSPEKCGLANDQEVHQEAEAEAGSTLRQALSTPAFWIFALSSSIYGLIASGIGLFNESILVQRGFDASTYHRTLAITALTALLGNFLGGWLAERWSMNRLMAVAMALLSASLVALPHVSTQFHVLLYAIVMGLAGGFVIVLFFSFWSRAYGRKHLGKIQGSAQTLTVLGSAIGPYILAECLARTGSYATVFYFLAALIFILCLGAWFVSTPSPATFSPEISSNRKTNAN
jgi:MFS family permease